MKSTARKTSILADTPRKTPPIRQPNYQGNGACLHTTVVEGIGGYATAAVQGIGGYATAAVKGGGVPATAAVKGGGVPATAAVQGISICATLVQAGFLGHATAAVQGICRTEDMLCLPVKFDLLTSKRAWELRARIRNKHGIAGMGS